MHVHGKKINLISCKLGLEILVDDKVDHRLANAPVRGGHAAPKTFDSLQINN